VKPGAIRIKPRTRGFKISEAETYWKVTKYELGSGQVQPTF